MLGDKYRLVRFFNKYHWEIRVETGAITYGWRDLDHKGSMSFGDGDTAYYDTAEEAEKAMQDNIQHSRDQLKSIKEEKIKENRKVIKMINPK